MTWTPDTEARARELLSKATPRPWVAYEYSRTLRQLKNSMESCKAGRDYKPGVKGWTIARFPMRQVDGPTHEEYEANHALMAEAPTLLEFALAEIERLRQYSQLIYYECMSGSCSHADALNEKERGLCPSTQKP